MTSTKFINGGAIGRPIYQYRVKNSQEYRFVQADSLHEASLKLSKLNISPDVLTYAGEIVEALV